MSYRKNKLKKAEPFAMLSIIRQHKGQIAETTIWIVATVIIIVILTISVYAASILSGVIKTINMADSVSFLKEQRTNIFLKESLLAYALTKNKEGINIYKQIETEKKLNDFASGFSIEVFKRVHDSPNILSMFLRYNEQNYNIVSFGYFSQKFLVVEKIKIGKDSSLELVLHSDESKENPTT